ncbi:MAG: hypothetical protein LBJ19_00660 [Holosporaceae bacterium]|nr:hypothetical protein [Holosporaceae bacterium]
MRELWLFVCFSMLFFNTSAREIYTPATSFDGNHIAIKTPLGWGYRTFPGINGLIGVLWLMYSNSISFNNADTVIFIFLQSRGAELLDAPDNVHLFKEKCKKSTFKFASDADARDNKKSIYEKYFSGPCGSTMVVFEEEIGSKRLICALVSAKKEISQSILYVTREVIKTYKQEIKLQIENKKSRRKNKKKHGDSKTS